MSIHLLCLRVASFFLIIPQEIFLLYTSLKKAAGESNFSETTNKRASSFQHLPISIRPEDSEYWIITKLAPFRRTLIQERQLFSISEGKMFTLNHKVLFPERMFSSQFSIVGGNKINQPLFVCWVGGDGGVFSCSQERLLSVTVNFNWLMDLSQSA